MKKLTASLFTLLLVLALACGSSQEGASKKGSSDESGATQLASGSIGWAKFDEGLTAISKDSSHMMAYFWRDG